VGVVDYRGGTAGTNALDGKEGTISGIECPKGLWGIFCEECPVGTYKNQTGLDFDLCKKCPPEDLPRRAAYSYVRGMSMSVFYPDPISSLVLITCGVS
jgi:hypothetical protein